MRHYLFTFVILGFGVFAFGANAEENYGQLAVDREDSVADGGLLATKAGAVSVAALPVEDVLAHLASQFGLSFVFDSRLLEGKEIFPFDSSSPFETILGNRLEGVGLELHKVSMDTFAISALKEIDSAVMRARPKTQNSPGAPVDENRGFDSIFVTGSRIWRNPADETIPITEIDHVEFKTRGFVNTIEALEDIPFVGNGVNNLGNSVAIGDNNAFVDLFNFGTARTLSLIDGRRTVGSNQGSVLVPDSATGFQVDLTLINPALIKQVEIQAVSSGPIYGADAVAGVVNVILDREFEGFEATVQGGVTQEGDGGNYRIAGTWGQNIFDGKGHFIVGVEYLDSDNIQCIASRRNFCNNIDVINNPLSMSGSDGIADQVFQADQRNPQVPATGLINVDQVRNGSTSSLFFPSTLSNSENDQAFADFVNANGGLTPFEFALANPTLNGIDPLAFVGTFGLTSGIPTVPNTDPTGLAMGLTRLAVPLTFNEDGNATPFDLGDIVPPNIADQDDVPGGEGFALDRQQTIRAAQERMTFNALWNYDFAPHIRYEGDLWISRIDNSQPQDDNAVQSPGCGRSAGACGLPIFFEENPFVTSETLAAIRDIEAANGGAGSVFGEINGSQFFSLTRTLLDITDGGREGNLSKTYRTAHALYGEFEQWDRKFYWDIAASWSRNTSLNRAPDSILDVEFALATDVVTDNFGNVVCRQQTLAQPEAIDVRNPQLANIDINTQGGLVPTQKQIDACVPLNLLGFGRLSQAARDYVTANDGGSFNKASQWYAAASLGGAVFELPAGAFRFDSQIAWRREALQFSPDATIRAGATRRSSNATGESTNGVVHYLEGGIEFRAPILSDEIMPRGIPRLELEGAVRLVHKTGEGSPFGNATRVELKPTTDLTFAAGGRFSPFEGVTIRGSRARAVRSASIVESLGGPREGFSGLAGLFPCNQNSVNGGPSSGIRALNCSIFEESLGLAAGTFAALNPQGGTVPAAIVGNPNIRNEIANNWTVGVVFQPKIIPGLIIEADWMSLLLDDQISLSFLGFECFDQTSFPNSVIGGVNACSTITLATESAPGSGVFIIPDTNIITGEPVLPPAVPGTLAPIQENYTIAAANFSNVNQGSQRLSGLTSKVSYNFDIDSVVRKLGLEQTGLGSLGLAGQVFYLDRFQTSSSGEFGSDTVDNHGQPLNEKFRTRLDLTHRLGNLAHQIQWFRVHKSVENPDDTQPLDEEPDFFRPEYNRFNYNISYKFNDNVTGSLAVNNILNARQLTQYGTLSDGVAGGNARVRDAVGRNFVFSISAHF